jgi:hypothetical protein
MQGRCACDLAVQELQLRIMACAFEIPVAIAIVNILFDHRSPDPSDMRY